MKACDWESLGLTDDEGAALTGFTSRMVAALAHLREAWVSADDSNAVAIEMGLRGMMKGHSLTENKRIVCKVLTHGLDKDQRVAILRGVGLL